MKGHGYIEGRKGHGYCEGIVGHGYIEGIFGHGFTDGKADLAVLMKMGPCYTERKEDMAMLKG